MVDRRSVNEHRVVRTIPASDENLSTVIPSSQFYLDSAAHDRVLALIHAKHNTTKARPPEPKATHMAMAPAA